MDDTTIPVVEKIDASDLNPMQREVNRGLMVHFINADLINRAALDVRHSTVFYDESKTFCYAANWEVSESQLALLRANTDVRFYSIGC